MFINPIAMLLHITSGRVISEIQKEFNRIFPFLKIEFFNNRSLQRTGFSVQQIIPHYRKIGEGLPPIKDGDIEITEDMKVNMLEKQFKDQFGLAVQVFRKSGNLWLETTMTDNWTLQQQNNHGREISTSKAIKPAPDDYDLNRDADH